MKRLAIISTHPIQYNAPWFKILTERNIIKLKVFYTWSQRQNDFFDKDFGKEIIWDIPLLDGYDYTFVPNKALKPSNKSFWGIDCPLLNQSIEEWGATHLLVFGWNFKAHFAAMRHFKGRITILFRGDSTLLDYDIKTLKDVLKPPKKRTRWHTAKCYLKYIVRKQFLSFIYRYVDKALYVGTNNKSYFLAHGLKEEQLKLVTHAIDNSRFTDSSEKKYAIKAEQWRLKIGIKTSDIVILFAGKFEPRKNPQILLKAFLNFKRNNSTSNLKLILLGNGPLEKELRTAAKYHPDVFLLGFKNQSLMPIVYRLGTIFCLPSISETWGLAVNEALASGVPVLLSHKVGSAIDLVNVPPCEVFHAADQQSLEDAIEKTFNFFNRKPDDKQWSYPMEDYSFSKLVLDLEKSLE